VKHLNPRQGITTRGCTTSPSTRRETRPCETPKSPPGDYNWAANRTRRAATVRRHVKHLNPRQGITTEEISVVMRAALPRSACETPKSPPGDYNRFTVTALV